MHNAAVWSARLVCHGEGERGLTGRQGGGGLCLLMALSCAKMMDETRGGNDTGERTGARGHALILSSFTDWHGSSLGAVRGQVT